jgi:hypothetical protein
MTTAEMTQANDQQTTRRRRARNDVDAATNAAAAESVRQLIEFALTERTLATGALFKIDDEKRSSNGPLMSGSLQIDGQDIPLSAFLKVGKESETEYLSLSLGQEGGIHYYGKLFRVENPKGANAPHYTGFMTVLACSDANNYSNEDWDEAPTLKVCGWRKRSANGTGRIHLTVSSTIVDADELGF